MIITITAGLLLSLLLLEWRSRVRSKNPNSYAHTVLLVAALLAPLAAFFGKQVYDERETIVDTVFYAEKNNVLSSALAKFQDTGVHEELARLSDVDEYYRKRIAEYLISSKDPILVNRVRELEGIADQLKSMEQRPTNIEAGCRFEPNPLYLDKQLHLFSNTNAAHVGVFPRSFVYVDKELIVVGRYSNGWKAQRHRDTAYVIDSMHNRVIASKQFYGSEPSATVSSANVFSSPTGSGVSRRRISNWYRTLVVCPETPEGSQWVYAPSKKLFEGDRIWVIALGMQGEVTDIDTAKDMLTFRDASGTERQVSVGGVLVDWYRVNSE